MILSRPKYKKIKQDYQRKNLQNPFFRRARTGKRPYAVKLWVAGGLMLLAAAAWFFFFSSFWRWNQVKTEGLTSLPAAELENIIREQGSASRWIFLSQDNIFAFDAEQAEQKISAAYNFAGLNLNKTWPRTLTLKISERPYSFIWQEGTEMSYASADGYAIKEPSVSDEDKAKYPILDNQTGQTMIGARDKIGIKDEYLNFFLDLSAELSRHSDLPVQSFILDQEFNTIRVKFNDGPLVYFSIKSPAVEQVDNLILVKNAKIKDNFSKTNYIDLRYGDKIFVHPEFND